MKINMSIERQTKHLKSLVLGPSAQRNLSVIKSHTTDNF